LENINLNNNPVAKHENYYDKMKECAPNILVLDDELVLGSRFFDNKS